MTSMTSMEWVEVRGKTVEEAVSAGVRELGLDSPEAAEVEILQEPQRGFLGLGGQDALVRVKAKAKRRRRRRPRVSGGSESGGGRGEARGGGSSGRQPQPGRRAEQQRSGGQRGRQGAAPRRETGNRGPRPDRAPARPAPASEEESQQVDPVEQAKVVEDFLVGLLAAFGLEGEVSTRVDEDIIYVDVTGDQTEALIGPKGVILDAVLELCRTMVHRQSQAGARLRLDIAGYGERRREALRIYARRLAEKVLGEGGEIMLEPMNPADRKVVHDTIAEIEGVRSFSEGEDPERCVVIGPAEDE
jgi:spoIIIJ-associated protein